MFKLIIELIQRLLGLGNRPTKEVIAPMQKKKEELKAVVKEQDKKIEEIKKSGDMTDEELKKLFNGES